jgi:hypothetical protein
MLAAASALGLAATILIGPAQTAQAEDALPAGAVAPLDYAATGILKGMYGQYGRDWNWASPASLYVYPVGAKVGVVAVDKSNAWFTATTYGASQPASAGGAATYSPVDTKTVSFADFPVWGGFYAASDGNYYVVTGKANTAESKTDNVIAIGKYDANWQLLATGYVAGGVTQEFEGVYKPFEAGSVSMALVGGSLIVHTARQMFAAADGVRHQSNLTFEVDTATMATTSFDAKGIGGPYASHSFNQFVQAQGNEVVFVDHGDAYPRALMISGLRGYSPGAMTLDAAAGVYWYTYEPLKFVGDLGNNATYASVTGFELGQGQALVVGSSDPQDGEIAGVSGATASLKRNVFLVTAATGDAAPKKTCTWQTVSGTAKQVCSTDPAGSSSLTWLTQLSPVGTAGVGEPRLVKLSDNRFAVLYDVADAGSHTLNYKLIDSTGAVLASQSWPGEYFGSDSQPVLIGSSLWWADVPGETSTTPYLYALNVAKPTAPRVALTPSALSVDGALAVGAKSAAALKIVLDGETLTSGADYSAKVSGTSKVGLGKVVVTGKGRYSAKVTASVLVNPVKTKVTKATAGKGKVTVKWKKIAKSQVTKYQVAYRVKGDKSWKTKTVKASASSLAVKKLKKGKAYQVRVRAYKKIASGASNGTYYGAWSSVKTSAKVK